MSLLTISLTSPRVSPFFHRPTYPHPLFQTQVWDWQFVRLLCGDFQPTADPLLSWKALALFPHRRLYLCSCASLNGSFVRSSLSRPAAVTSSASSAGGPIPNQPLPPGSQPEAGAPHHVALLFPLTCLFWALGPVAQPSCCYSAFLFHFGYSDIVIFLLLGEGISFKISLFICMLLLPCFWSKNCKVTELSQSWNFP